MTKSATSLIDSAPGKMPATRLRQLSSVVFVVVWIALFFYETLRLNYLSPLLGRALPKLPLLYPPAGWIMFYQIEPRYGYAEVYRINGKSAELIDPHDIFATQAIGYDNIHRNMLVSVLDARRGEVFCAYLKRKFPDAGGFAIVHAEYPDLIASPDRVLRRVSYRCE